MKFVKLPNNKFVPLRLYEKYGTYTFFREKFLPFKKARNVVRSFNLQGFNEWREFCSSGQRPKNIPAEPQFVYEQYLGMRDWLGNEFLSFEEARAFVRELGLNSHTEWLQYLKSGKRPRNIPSSPNIIYQDCGWEGVRDWLGAGDKFLPFDEARAFVQKLNITGEKGWREWKKNGRPSFIPSSPDEHYKNKGWVNWTHWFGTGGFPKQFLSFKDAKKFARKLRLKNKADWFLYWRLNKRPNNIPSNPSQAYKGKGWTNYSDFLGKVNNG